jgi:oligopeptide/dipeptide ABC transporter ATP-binding protein
MIRAILKAPGTIFALIVIAVLVGTMIVAPIVLNKDATGLNFSATSEGPNAMHWLGTDALGRDLLARLLVATRLSLGLAFLATLISAVLGLLLGGGVALLPARIRPIGLRFIDTLIAFPALIVAIFVGAIIGAGGKGATIGVGVAGSFYIARVMSALVLSSASRDYILAARILGVRRMRLLLRNILPNVADVLVIVVALGIANSIVFLAAMSFLGLGVQSPQFDWGQLLTEGVQQFYQAPLSALAPAIAIAISALAFGFAGEAVAKSLNPQLWTAMRSIKGPGAMLGTRASKILSQRIPTPSDEKEPALEVSNLSVQIPNKPSPIDIVTDISFVVAQGEMLGVVGESGSGKTTVANAISQLLPYPAKMNGTVKISGRDISTLTKDEFNQLLGTNVATVFQDPMSSLNPALRLDIQLTERAEVHQHIGRRQAREMAIANLKEVNLPAAEGQMRRYPHELSGGMRQRVMMAMGLMTRPALLIADEPTTALDVTIQAQIMDVLKEINQQHKMAIVLISHNLDLVGQNCDRILVMYAGRIVEELSREALSQPLHPYTQALLGALPDISESPDQPLVSIGGQVPDISNRPSGCAFHPRCPMAVERCTTEVPPLLPRRGGAVACWVANKDADNESA